MHPAAHSAPQRDTTVRAALQAKQADTERLVLNPNNGTRNVIIVRSKRYSGGLLMLAALYIAHSFCN